MSSGEEGGVWREESARERGRTRDSPDTVKVGIGVSRGIVVDDDWTTQPKYQHLAIARAASRKLTVHALHVDSSSEDIGRHEHALLKRLELLVTTDALVLG
jgi:hypothetical protein